MKIVKPLKFDPFTFSRPSEGTFLNASGLIETAENDVLREAYEYDEPTDTLTFAGPLIEGEAINFAPNIGSWKILGSPPVVTLNYDTSPSGDNDAVLVSPVGSTSGLRCTAAGGRSNDNVFSVFLKALAPDTTVRLSISGAYGSISYVYRINPGDWVALGPQANITPYPNGWFRCEIYGTGFDYGELRIYGMDADFLVWGPQHENAFSINSYRATSYIEAYYTSNVDVSGTSITRNSGAAFTSYYEGQGISIGGSNTVIDNIADADNMTVLNAIGTVTNTEIRPKAYRAADFVTSQSPSLVSSNIAEDDAPIWDNDESYVAGDRVMVLGEYHRVYESLDSNSGKYPPDYISDPDVHWIDVGATNRWRMYDMNVGSDLQSYSTNSDGSIDHLMAVDDPVTSVILLNVEGDLARVTMRDGSNNVIYQKEIELLGTPMGVGWWEFFFDYRDSISTIVITDLPKITPATIRVEIEGALSKIGKLILGEDMDIGCTRPGVTVGITSFSRKERDEFGNFYIVPRRSIGKGDFQLQMTSDKVDAVYDILASLADIPAVYIGSEQYKSTIIYGFWRDFSIVIPGPFYSQCNLSVEGL